MQRAARTAKVLAVAIALVAVGSVTGAYASHQFSDVPQSSPIHLPVDHIARAGITTGYADGTYQPTRGITRGEMAAFLDRGLGRVAYDEGSTTTTASGDLVITDVRIRSGAAGGEGGFVVLTSTFDVFSPAVIPPAQYSTTWSLFDDTDGRSGPRVGVPWTHDRVGGTLTWVVPIDPQQTKVIQLIGRVDDGPPAGLVLTGRITAQYVPFGWTGGGQLDFDPIIIGGADTP